MNPADYRQRLEELLWRDPVAATPLWKILALRVMRMAVALARDTTRGELTLRAMGLVYTTLLSLVPLLALSFSVLKAFGVHNQIRPLLQGLLLPFGEGGEAITERLVLFIDNMRVGVLGSLGLALLIYTAVSVVQKVEEAFNFIWHVTQPRRFGERFSRYLTLLLVGPILVFSALGITASVMNADLIQDLLDIEAFGRLFMDLSRLTPYLLVIAAFTFAYYFIPNTRVRLKAALVGGMVAGIAWQTAGWAFAVFSASSRQYRAIYSSFAILILFMMWIYLSWRILLFGASVAFYHQHPEYLFLRGGAPRLSHRLRERLALGIMSHIAGDFRAGRPPLSAESLARRLGAPIHAIQGILDTLEAAGIAGRMGASPPVYLPARDPASVSVARLLTIVRCADEANSLSPDLLLLPPEAGRLAQRIDEALAAALGDSSLADLAARPGEPGKKSAPAKGSLP